MSKGPLLLAGSGEFTDSLADVDRFFLRSVKNPSIAIIPTAAGLEHDWWKWADNGITYYKKLGYSAYGVPLRTRKDTNDPAVIQSLKSADIYYFSGGDPGYVLSVMKESTAWDVISERFRKGAGIAGSSAGAMMLGSYTPANIRGVLEQGTDKTEWKRALGLVPYVIWPHFDWAKRTFGDKIRKMMVESTAKSRWLGIDENTAVLWEPSKKPVTLGSGKAHWGHMD